MSRFKLPCGLLVLAAAVLASGCQDDKIISPTTPPALVITGLVADSVQNLAGATVRAQMDSGWTSIQTDAGGQYLLALTSRPDSITVCVSAVNYVDRCSTFSALSDTLHADWRLIRRPPSDTIFLGSDTVFAGDTAQILINIGNPDSVIAGMNLWLKPEVSSIMYDTIAPVTPRFPISGMDWSAKDHDTANIVAILFVDFQFQEFIPPGSGPVMQVSYAVDAATPPGTYKINSEALSGVARSWDLSYKSGLSMPEVLFIPGTIVVQ